jgi:hypothetical protein
VAGQGRVRRQIESLWRLGYGPQARRVTPRQWDRLSNELDALAVGFEHQRWRFASPGESA